jgi:hypothetical protein
MVFFSIVCLSYENFIKKNMKLIEVCLLLVAIWGWVVTTISIYPLLPLYSHGPPPPLTPTSCVWRL